MAQETIVDFSVIKQKIIKTDEILRMYQETTNKLKKVQQVYKELKLSYDQVVLNLNRLQLENERCTFNFENMKSHLDGREKENKELREQIALLEDKYNHKTIQSQLDIKKLEEELKILRELKTPTNIKCKKKQSQGTEDNSAKKVKSLEEKIKELENIETKYKKENEELNKKNENLTSTLFTANQQYSETIRRLESENKCLIGKIDKPNYQVEENDSIAKTNCNELKTQITNLNQEKDKQINELKKKICRLTLDLSKLKTVEEENDRLKQQLMDQEMTLFNASEERSRTDVCTQTDETDMLPKNQRSPVHRQIMKNIVTQLEKSPNIDTETLHKLNEEAQHKEIVKLKNKISSLILDKNRLKNIEDQNEELKQLLIKQENNKLDINKNKSLTDFCMQTDILPRIKKKSIHVQTLETMKLYKLQETLDAENQTLKQSVIDYETEIMSLRAELEVSRRRYSTEEIKTEQDLDVIGLEDIFEEMLIPIPKILSPMSPAFNENLKIDMTLTPISGVINSCSTHTSTVIPDVIVTPPTPTIEPVLYFQNDQTSSDPPKKEEVCLQHTVDYTNKDNLRNSRKSDKIPYFKKVPKRRKYRSPCISNEFVKLRKDYFSRSYILNKQLFRREMRKVRKLKNHDCMLKALQTLKQSKINFTISNESILPKCWSNNDWLNDCQLTSSSINTMQTKRFAFIPKYKNAKYLTEKLNCTSPSCSKDNCYMLLNKRNDTTELLGFFSVKDEIFTPSCSRVDNILDNKQSDLISAVNPILSDTSKLTSSKLLETLADLVSKKLKQMEHSERGTPIISENNFDSFNSETETELETLFEKPDYVLRRNKTLLKKQHKICASLSDSNLEEQDIQRKEIEENCNTHTENCNTQTVPSNMPYKTEKILNNERTKSIERTLQNININENDSVSYPVAECQETDSCDSLKFSTCPELISPLSTISKEFKTPPSKSGNVWPVNGSKELDIYFTKNSAILPVSSIITEVNPTKDTEGKNLSNLITRDELESESNSMKSSLIKQSFEILSSNSCSYITSLNSTDNVGNGLNDTSTSSIINTYLCDEKALSKDLNTLLIEFEEGKCLIEDKRKIDTRIRADESSILHLRSLLHESPVKMNSSLNKLDYIALEDKLQKSIATEKGEALKNLTSKGLLLKKHSMTSVNTTLEENITAHDFTEMRITAKENETVSLDRDEAKSCLPCSKSPVHEEFEGLVNPIIIPLEKVNDEDVTDNFCPAYISNHVSNSPKSLDCEDLKIPSLTNMNQKGKEVSSEPSNLIYPTNNNVVNDAKMLTTKKTNFLNGLNEGTLYITNTKKVYSSEKGSKIGEDFINSGSSYISLSNDEEAFPIANSDTLPNEKIENILSCPQSPINNSKAKVDFIDPKIIPLEKLETEGNMATLSFSHDSQKTNTPESSFVQCTERESTSIDGLDSGKCQPFFYGKILDPPVDMTSSGNKTTRDILNALRNNENIPSCPQSPVNDKIDFMDPKIIPLEKLKCEDMANISDSIPIRSLELKNDLLKLNQGESESNNDNNAATMLLSKRNLSTSPMVLRRSKRNRKRNKEDPTLSPKSSNNIEHTSTPKFEDTGPSYLPINNKRLKMIEATPPSDTQNASLDILPVKRKRGRPRKHPVEQIITSQFDGIKCTEDMSESINFKELANENLDPSQRGTLEEKNISELSLKTVHEVPLEENLELSTTPTRVLDNVMSTTCLNNTLADFNNDAEGAVCQNSSQLTFNLDELAKKNKRMETIRNRAVKRRPITKLKSNILKQFKEKRKMFQTNVEIANLVNNSSACDIKSNNVSEYSVDNKQTNTYIGIKSKVNTSLAVRCTSNTSDTKQKCNRKKINVVQNILIPPNSNYTVDLLKRKEYAHYEFASNCDIRLDNPQNSSQNSINFDGFAFHKNNRSVSINDNIPAKKKKLECKKTNPIQDNDILSKIMDEMDKDKIPKILPNAETITNKPKETINASISDEQWRKSILEIAECTHNISTDERDVIIMIGKQSLIKNPKDPPSKKVKLLMSRLVQLSSDEIIADEIILEFKRHPTNTIADIILQKVSQDTVDKAENKYYPAPLMTNTQRILLNLMVRLESENVENLMDTFLTKAELYLFKIGCGIRTMVPVTRLYMAVCRLRANVNRMRAFCFNAFLFMGDLAVPLLFTVLTSWTEILPMESDLKYYPLTKVLVQVVHLKDCNKPGYNLLPLRALLNQFYGYPRERWDCDKLFEELFQQYLRNPVTSMDIGVRVFCKNKDTKWVYKKVNEFLKPLIYKIPAENVNFKATAIVLIGKICRQFKPALELDETYLNDIRRWLIGLTEGDPVSDIVERSVNFSLLSLPKKLSKAKKKKKKQVIKVANVFTNKKRNKKQRKQFKKKLKKK